MVHPLFFTRQLLQEFVSCFLDMQSPVNSRAWFVRFAAIALFFIPVALLKIELNSTLRVIAVFLIGVVTPLAFLKFAFKAAAMQANQDLRAPCGVLSSGFQGTAKMPKLMTLPGYTLLMTIGPSASLSTLLEYPFRTTGMLLGIAIGCLWSFATIWIIWRFMTMAELQNAQCSPGKLYDAFGEFSTSPPQTDNGSQTTSDVSSSSNSQTSTSTAATTQQAKKRDGKKTKSAKKMAFDPPAAYREHADHHFQRGIQHAQQQYLLRELQQQRVARHVMQQQQAKPSISMFNPLSFLKR